MMRTFAYVSCGEGREINVFSLDPLSGEVSLCQRLATAGSPVPIRVVPDALRLYVGMRTCNALQSFSIDRKTGLLKTLGGVTAPGAPVYVFCDAAMRMVFSSSYGDDNLSVFPLDEHGVPLPARQTEVGLPRAHAARLDPSGRWLLVPTLGADAIRIFEVVDGVRIVANDPPEIKVRSGSGPRHPVFSPDARFVYCLNELDGCIDTFSFDSERGVLDLKNTISIMPKTFVGNPWTAELRITQDGRFLYATDRRSNTIVALAVNSETGGLSVIAHTSTEAVPRGMDIDFSGRWLVVAGQQSGYLSVYAIDSVSGRLEYAHRHRTGKEPICVEITTI